jgi:hypothetical protein
MKFKLAMVMFVCGCATMAMAQDKAPEKAPDKAPDKPADAQCLIVAPRPVFKYEMRDSYNLAKENVKDVYKQKDLTDLRKLGVHVIVIDPLGKQLEKAQAACREPQK